MTLPSRLKRGEALPALVDQVLVEKFVEDEMRKIEESNASLENGNFMRIYICDCATWLRLHGLMPGRYLLLLMADSLID